MRGRHEDGDERAARRGARERIGAHAEPAGMVAVLFTGPQLLVLGRLDVLDGAGTPALKLLALHRARLANSDDQAVGPEGVPEPPRRRLLRALLRRVQGERELRRRGRRRSCRCRRARCRRADRPRTTSGRRALPLTVPVHVDAHREVALQQVRVVDPRDRERQLRQALRRRCRSDDADRSPHGCVTSRMACAAPPARYVTTSFEIADRRFRRSRSSPGAASSAALARVPAAAEIQRHLALDEIAVLLGEHHEGRPDLLGPQDQVTHVRCRHRTRHDGGECERNPHLPNGTSAESGLVGAFWPWRDRRGRRPAADSALWAAEERLDTALLLESRYGPACSSSESATETYSIYRLDALQAKWDVARLPYTLRILLENVLRNGSDEEVEAVAGWVATDEPSREISFAPARVLLQDFTGVPCVVDLAAMRNAMQDQGGDPGKINPLIPVELVIDHSVQVDEFASRLAIGRNVELEFERNRERYAFLRWGQSAFDNFAAVPPNTGICHQVNLEFLARVVESRDGVAFPDTLVGTDSHTTMVNGLGVLGWGVGGIEAEAAMLGEALSMLVPQVVGLKLTGALPQGATATDLVLTVTEILRKVGCRREVRRVLRRRRAVARARRPRDAREHEPRVRRDVRLLPRRRRDAQLPAPDGPPGRAHCARRGVLQGEHALARPARSSDVLGGRRARPLVDRAVARRAAPAAGSRAAREREGVVHRSARHVRRRLRQRQPRQGASPTRSRRATRRPSSSPAASRSRWRMPRPRTPRPASPTKKSGAGTRRGLLARARLRRDLRDHLVHEHVEPVGDDRRRAAREEGDRERPDAQAVGQVVARAGLQGRHRVLRALGPRRVSRRARLQPRRLRLHDLHRKLGPASRTRSGKRSPRAS